jgi:hypothetical protein
MSGSTQPLLQPDAISWETRPSYEDLLAADPNATIEPNVLCPQCQDIVRQSKILNGKEKEIEVTIDPWDCEERLEQFAHYQEMDTVQQSSSKGCHFCSHIWAVADHNVKSGAYVYDIEDIDDKDEDSVPQFGSHILSEAFLRPGHNAEKRKAVDRARKRAQLIEALGPEARPGIIIQISCDGSEYRSDLHISISVEVNGYIGIRAETTDRRMLSVTEPIVEEEAEWEANRDDRAEIYNDAQVSISTASEGSMKLARKWLDHCLSEHRTCKDVHSWSNILPTRLIDVGSSPDAPLRLCVARHIRPAPVYLTLSHCWGGAKILRLLKDNYDEFRQAIPKDELPLTFRNAVDITRRLGYRYIWIDSLCIIQDSLEDWAAESALMGDIYCGSVCTVSALAAKDSHAGTFTTRNPLRYIPCRLTSGVDTGLIVRGASLAQSRSCRGPLLSRGWVFQERALSPRTIHFGPKSIYWECIECDASEPWPHGDDTWDWNKDKRYRRPKEAFFSLQKTNITSKNSMPPHYQMTEFLHAWYELRREYSYCNLTRREDMLVAINGVMKKISERQGLSIVAGLWKEFLLAELLWNTSKSETHAPEVLDPKQWRAPSWSWARVDKNIQNRFPELVRGHSENILGMFMWISYTLEWKAEIVEVDVKSEEN